MIIFKSLLIILISLILFFFFLELEMKKWVML